MVRFLGFLVLASSLLAVSQTPPGTTNSGGFIAPAMPGAPLITTPNVALPGDGPATGAPPALGVNDSRNGGSGSVFQPAAGTLLGGSELPGATAPMEAASTPAANNGSMASNRTFNAGAFVEGSTNANGPSLADVARQYKAQRANAHPRSFDNSNIRHASYGTSDTNAAALPQGDQASAATYGSTGAASVPQGVMNAGDYASVQAALARSQAAANTNASSNTVASVLPDPNRTEMDNDGQQSAGNTNQQRSAASNNSGSNSSASNNSTSNNSATTPQVDDSANSTPARSKEQLPASASPLPLISLLGLIALTVGGIFAYRKRSDLLN